MADVFYSDEVLLKASNLQHGENPPYLLSDFYKMYPQFENKVDDDIIQLYIDFGTSCISQLKWRSAWKLGMSYFVAHFCIITMQGRMTPESTEAQVLSAAQAKGLVSSKSAGDVSLSYDFSAMMDDLQGWAQFKLTTYGIQYASLAKIYGRGAIYVY
jgi:hypothetical protein